MEKDNLRLIVLDSHKELGRTINNHLKKINNTEEDYIIPVVNNRFNNGEGKVRINGSVREKDIYILADVGNYSTTYNMHGFLNHFSPDDHFQDIKRVISAISGHASSITVVMPLLYESRQHKRKGRESLDSALALRELENLKVNNIITFDAHDPSICNAIPNVAFDNIFPTKEIIKQLQKDNKDLNNLIVISPDMGAMERARYYAEVLKVSTGVFYKRRDLSKVVNGKNPILEHVYMGEDVKNKNVLIVDDMIASGTSMLEVATMLKEKGANKVFMTATFALFTEGIEEFDRAHSEGIFDYLYSTNLSYVPEKLKNCAWYKSADMSIILANVINDLNKKESLSKYYEKI